VRKRYSLKAVLRIWDDLFERVGARGKKGLAGAMKRH
jgi:hypothetical protein